MDYKTFITEMTKALAWPITVIWIVRLLRIPLAALIPLLNEIEWKGFKAKFDRGMEKAEKAAIAATHEALPAKLNSVTGPGDPFHQLLRALDEAEKSLEDDRLLLETSAATTILVGWAKFEAAVIQAAKRVQLSIPLRTSLVELSAQFFKEHWLTPSIHRLIIALGKLRNLAAYGEGSKISPAQAARFLAMIEPLVRYFEELRPDSLKPPPTE